MLILGSRAPRREIVTSLDMWCNSQMNDFSISHTAQDTGLALTSKLELVSECGPVSLATHKRLRVFMPPHASASVLVLGSS